MKKCEWLRSFDGHFGISCVNETGQRASGKFHPDDSMKNTDWHFTFCPYCGGKIEIIYNSDQASEIENVKRTVRLFKNYCEKSNLDNDYLETQLLDVLGNLGIEFSR